MVNGMSALIRYLNKPEYLFQPRTIVRRLMSRPGASSVMEVPLPWGTSIETDAHETIGRTLVKHGMFEIAVVEAMFRLIDDRDRVLDIGANIGFMSAAAAASHSHVTVTAIEPHPVLFERLVRNINGWTAQRPDMRGRVRAMQTAVSDSPGRAALHIPQSFAGNQGIASLVKGSAAPGSTTVEVQCTTIDEIVSRDVSRVGLLKIDVEGHEIAAFRGGEESLAQRKIRDIIFEDHEGLDSEVCRVLSGFGYKLYFLGKLPWGPWLCRERDAVRAAAYSFDSPNFLATLEPGRAESRMAPLGYRCIA